LEEGFLAVALFCFPHLSPKGSGPTTRFKGFQVPNVVGKSHKERKTNEEQKLGGTTRTNGWGCIDHCGIGDHAKLKRSSRTSWRATDQLVKRY